MEEKVQRHRGAKAQRGDMVKTYRDLVVWQKSMVLVTEVYEISKEFPKDELYGLTSQIRRCAISLPSNIAEGYGRNSTNDYIHFLRIASGSLYELQTQMEISLNLQYIDRREFESLYELSREIERMLSSLIRKLREK
ncbi:MAG: four helix bundle protein [Thermodesulfobacteriota bacterium]|nr:four helix bundle protein [Thermodesulfobacteriota bacterium]